MKKIILFLLFILSIVCFANEVGAASYDLTLQWDENTEPDLATGDNARYKIYYRTGSSGGGLKSNYIGLPAAEPAQADEGVSPVCVTVAQDENPDPDIVQYTLHNVDDAVDYYIAVSACDDEQNESLLSDEINTGTGFVDKTPPAAPKNLKGFAGYSNIEVTVRVIINLSTGEKVIEKIVSATE